MDKIETRIATTSDIKELAELLTVLFLQEADFKPDQSKQETGLNMILNNSVYGHVIVATKSKKIVRMVSLLYLISTAEGAKVAILEDMVVNPEYNYGIGSALLTEAVNFSKEQGCKRITLLTDFDNEKAIKRSGFF